MLGEKGILPVDMLAPRHSDALMEFWCIGTEPRPNSLLAIELNPERTRSFLIASLKFENARPPCASGPNPLCAKVVL